MGDADLAKRMEAVESTLKVMKEEVQDNNVLARLFLNKSRDVEQFVKYFKEWVNMTDDFMQEKGSSFQDFNTLYETILLLMTNLETIKKVSDNIEDIKNFNCDTLSGAENHDSGSLCNYIHNLNLKISSVETRCGAIEKQCERLMQIKDGIAKLLSAPGPMGHDPVALRGALVAIHMDLQDVASTFRDYQAGMYR